MTTPTNFRIFYDLEGVKQEPMIVAGYTPEKAEIELKRLHAGKRVYVHKIKRVKDQ